MEQQHTALQEAVAELQDRLAEREAQIEAYEQDLSAINEHSSVSIEWTSEGWRRVVWLSRAGGVVPHKAGWLVGMHACMHAVCGSGPSVLAGPGRVVGQARAKGWPVPRAQRLHAHPHWVRANLTTTPKPAQLGQEFAVLLLTAQFLASGPGRACTPLPACLPC